MVRLEVEPVSRSLQLLPPLLTADSTEQIRCLSRTPIVPPIACSSAAFGLETICRERADLLENAPAVSPNGAAALLRAGETPSVVAITAPTVAVASGSQPGRTLAITTQSGTRSDLLIAEATSTLFGSKIHKKEVAVKSSGRRGDRDNRPRTKIEATVVKFTKAEDTECRRVPWGISDGKVTVIPDASMPSAPLESMEGRSVLFGAFDTRSGGQAAYGQVGESLLRAPRPFDTATESYTGREVAFRGLATGTLLTLVGRAWIDGSGVMHMTAEAGMPSAVTRMGAPSLVSSLRWDASWMSVVGTLLVVGGSVSAAACVWYAYNETADERRGPRAGHVGSGTSGEKSVDDYRVGL